jgi:hypothetical protein
MFIGGVIASSTRTESCDRRFLARDVGSGRYVVRGSIEAA